MRILIAAHNYWPNIRGGAEISSQLLAEGLAAKGHEVHVFTSGLQDEIVHVNKVQIIRKYIKYSSDIFYTSSKSNQNKKMQILQKLKSRTSELVYDPFFYFFYSELLDKSKYDVVCSSTHMCNFGRYNLWLSAKRRKIPVFHIVRDTTLIHTRSNLEVVNSIYRYFTKKGINMLMGIIGPSKAILELHNTYNISNKNQKIIPNAVDISFSKRRYVKKNTILYAGRITEHKGVLTLIDAFKTPEFNKYELILIGKNELDARIEVPSNIKFLKWVDRDTLYEMMADSKLVVLPSEWPEPFGRIIIEAVAKGTIAIGSNIGGIPEIFDMDQQYIFESGNVIELRKKMVYFCNIDTGAYTTKIELLQKNFLKFTRENYIKSWEEFIIDSIRKKNEN